MLKIFFLFRERYQNCFFKKKNLLVLKYNVKENRLICKENVFNEYLVRSIILTIKARILLQFYEVAISQIIMLHCLVSCREMVTEILTIFEILHI